MRRRSFLLILPALLAGCALGPLKPPPAPPAPAHWVNAQGEGVWPDARWWRAFGDPELDRLIARARADSPDLKAAWERVLEARAQAEIAGAALYPALEGDLSAGRSRGVAGRDTKSFQANGLASYQLDLFGQNRATARAGEALARSSLYDRQTVALTLTANTATSYFQLLSARERLALAEETLRNARSILALLQDQQRIGTVSDLEVAQQQSAVASLQAAVSSLRLAQDQSLNALALLVGGNPGSVAVTARSLDVAHLPPVMAGLPSRLLERRPDVAKAESDLRAANFNVAAARAARFPSLTLTAEGGSASTQLSNLFAPGSAIYQLAAGLTAPIFDGGKLAGQERYATARYRELAAAWQQTALSAFRDVADALAAVDQDTRRAQALRMAETAARRAYDLSRTRYRVGTVDFLTVLQAQQTLIQAQDARAQADLAHATALVGLYQALGGGWEAP